MSLWNGPIIWGDLLIIGWVFFRNQKTPRFGRLPILPSSKVSSWKRLVARSHPCQEYLGTNLFWKGMAGGLENSEKLLESGCAINFFFHQKWKKLLQICPNEGFWYQLERMVCRNDMRVSFLKERLAIWSPAIDGNPPSEVLCPVEKSKHFCCFFLFPILRMFLFNFKESSFEHLGFWTETFAEVKNSQLQMIHSNIDAWNYTFSEFPKWKSHWITVVYFFQRQILRLTKYKFIQTTTIKVLHKKIAFQEGLGSTIFPMGFVGLLSSFGKKTL